MIAPRLARRRRAEARLHPGRALAEHEFELRVFHDAGDFPGVDIDEPGLRIKRHQRCIGAARRPDFDRFAPDGALVDVAQNRAAGLEIDVRGPVDLHERVRRDQLAVGAIDDIHEAVLVGVQEHLADLAADAQIGEHRLGGAVEVVAFVRNVLVMPDQLAGLGPDREHAGRVQTVGAAAIHRVVRLRVAGTPVDEVEFGVIRTVLPGRPAAVFPCVGHFLGPGFGSGLAGRGHGVAAPQFFPAFRIPAVEEAARGAVPARHPGDHHAVRHQRRDDSRVTFLEVGEFLLPHLLAGLHVERDDVAVYRLAKKLPVVEGRWSPNDDAGVPDTRSGALVFHRCAPDLLAGRNVEGEGPISVHHIHDAVIDRRLRQLARIVA